MSFRSSLTSRIQTLLAVLLIVPLSACYDDDGGESGGSTAVGVVVSPNTTDTGNPATPSSGSDVADVTEDEELDTGADTDTTPLDTSSPYKLTLSWRASTGLIDGYMIFHGPTPESATALLSITLETTIHYDPQTDLGLNLGDASCFRIKAYNAEGSSDFSDAVCFTYNTSFRPSS